MSVYLLGSSTAGRSQLPQRAFCEYALIPITGLAVPEIVVSVIAGMT